MSELRHELAANRQACPFASDEARKHTNRNDAHASRNRIAIAFLTIISSYWDAFAIEIDTAQGKLKLLIFTES